MFSTETFALIGQWFVYYIMVAGVVSAIQLVWVDWLIFKGQSLWEMIFDLSLMLILGWAVVPIEVLDFLDRNLRKRQYR